MSYQPVGWKNNVTPLNEANLSHMDQGIKEAHDALNTLGRVEEDLVNMRNTVNKINNASWATFDSSSGTLKLLSFRNSQAD